MPVIGEVVFQRVFDLGGTLNMQKVRGILGEMAAAGAVQPSRSAPEYVSFAAPIPLNLSSVALDLKTEQGTPIAVHARLYEVGALGVMLRVQVRTENLIELARIQSANMYMRGELVRRAQVFGAIYDAIKPRLASVYDEIFNVPVEAESYTAYCLTEVPGGVDYIFRDERAQIAALLTGEPHPDRLSTMEIEDTLKNWSSYYKDDILVADWDAAFLVEPAAQYEDALYIFEVANLQLLELRKYDLYLDQTLERGYEQFDRLSKGPPISTGWARDMVRELNEVRMDLAKVTDEVANTAKFFGDWYAAKVYMGLAQRLHVTDYHKTVEEKLATLNDLYHSVLAEMTGRQNLVLELMIVLLIIFEVVMAFFRH